MYSDYTLAYGTHATPEDGRCAMEWVSHLAGEPHSDQPRASARCCARSASRSTTASTTVHASACDPTWLGRSGPRRMGSIRSGLDGPRLADPRLLAELARGGRPERAGRRAQGADAGARRALPAAGPGRARGGPRRGPGGPRRPGHGRRPARWPANWPGPARERQPGPEPAWPWATWPATGPGRRPACWPATPPPPPPKRALDPLGAAEPAPRPRTRLEPRWPRRWSNCAARSSGSWTGCCPPSRCRAPPVLPLPKASSRFLYELTPVLHAVFM